MPITWKNVGQTVSAGAAARLFHGATRSIEGGLDRITGALKTVESNREEKHDFDVDQNVNAYFDRLNQAKTPEELEQLESSGELNTMVQGFGNAIDSERIRDGVSNRKGELRDELTADRQAVIAERQTKLGDARDALNPVLQAFDAETDPAKKREIFERNPDLFAAAQYSGQAVSAIQQATVAQRAAQEQARIEQDREWDTKMKQITARFAADESLDFYQGQDAIEAAAEEAGIPADVYTPFKNGYATAYSGARNMGPDDAMLLDKTAQRGQEHIETTRNKAKIILERELANNAETEGLAWNRPGGEKFEPGNILTTLEDRGITQKTAMEDFETAWDNALRLIIEDEDGGIARLGTPKDGDPMENVPDEILNAKYAIMAQAASVAQPGGFMKSTFKNIGSVHRGVKGGVDGAEGLILDALESFRRSQEQNRARDLAQSDFDQTMSTARQEASAMFTTAEREARIRAGYKVPPQTAFGNAAPELSKYITDAVARAEQEKQRRKAQESNIFRPLQN